MKLKYILLAYIMMTLPVSATQEQVVTKNLTSGEIVQPVESQIYPRVAAEIKSEKFDVTGMIAHHLNDAPLWHLEIAGIDMSITKRVVMLWIVALLLIIVFIGAARSIKRSSLEKNKPTRFSGFIESLIQFIRIDVAKSSLGNHSKHYEPYLLTIFFFILFSNLIGLFPPIGELSNYALEAVNIHLPHVGGADHGTPLLAAIIPSITPTGDIGVTLTLAAFTLILIFLSGFIFQGIAFIKNVVPKGIAPPMWLIMWPIEFVSIFIKSGVLSIRLLANMTAGHVIILVLLSFIFQFQSIFVAPISVIGSAAIYMLEIFVAFLQAYIFTFLTALFIESAMHRH